MRRISIYGMLTRKGRLYYWMTWVRWVSLSFFDWISIRLERTIYLTFSLFFTFLFFSSLLLSLSLRRLLRTRKSLTNKRYSSKGREQTARGRSTLSPPSLRMWRCVVFAYFCHTGSCFGISNLSFGYLFDVFRFVLISVYSPLIYGNLTYSFLVSSPLKTSMYVLRSNQAWWV